jgi:hypothetical protein
MASFTQFVLGGTILADSEDPPLHGPIVIELYSKDSSIALVLYDLGTYVFMFMLVAVLVVLTLLLFKLGALHAHRAEQGLEALDVFQILGTGFDVQAARRLEQLGNEIPTTMCAGRLQPVVPCCNVLHRVVLRCNIAHPLRLFSGILFPTTMCEANIPHGMTVPQECPCRNGGRLALPRRASAGWAGQDRDSGSMWVETLVG